MNNKRIIMIVYVNEEGSHHMTIEVPIDKILYLKTYYGFRYVRLIDGSEHKIVDEQTYQDIVRQMGDLK